MALKVFTTGEVLTASDTNVYLVNNLAAEKTANESVTSSTVFQNDNELFVSVAANSTYMGVIHLFYEGHVSGDIKLQFTVPAGTTYYGTVTRLSTAATDTTGLALDASFDVSTILQAGALGAGVRCGMVAHITVHVASTAGTLQLQWAQLASNATATIVLDKSFLVLHRVV